MQGNDICLGWLTSILSFDEVTLETVVLVDENAGEQVENVAIIIWAGTINWFTVSLIICFVKT